MLTNTCFICSLSINGDSTYFQHHVNSCLDSPSSSSTSDALLAHQLASSINVEANLSHRWVPQPQEEGEGCPFCNIGWNELGVGIGDRDAHAEGCLRGDFEDPTGDEGWSDDIDFGKEVSLGSGGEKDKVVGVGGVIGILKILLESSHKDGKTKSAFLCNENVEHVQRQFKDMGWGCGYKNGQMIYSALRHLPGYSSAQTLKGKGKESDLLPIPTISEFQAIIEEAWKAGFDPDGKDHFNGKLLGKRKWIGTTEIYTALTFLGIRAKVIDFPKARKGGTQSEAHEALINWITTYFTTPSPPPTKKRQHEEEESSKNAFKKLMESNGSAVVMTGKQPLYLQHQGHSRTVVGIEKSRNGDWLLIFDPANPTAKPLRHPVSSAPISLSSNKRPKTDHTSFWASAPGATQIWGPNHKGFGKAGSGGIRFDTKDYSKWLGDYRVSLRGLSRNDEYQVLYVEDGTLLTERERESRKLVLATVVKE